MTRRDTGEAFEKLVAAIIAKDRDNGTDRPLRDFLRQFAGLKRSIAMKAVCDQARLSRCGLSTLLNCDGLDRGKTTALLSAMKEHSPAPKPQKLGAIGREHIAHVFDATDFKYKKIVGIESGLPFVVEAAFTDSADVQSLLLTTGWRVFRRP